MSEHAFVPFRTATVPVVFGTSPSAAIAAAQALAPEVWLAGVVTMSAEAELSSGGQQARLLRRALREMSRPPAFRSRAHVIVSQCPWEDLRERLAVDRPDLFVLDWQETAHALGVPAAEVLAESPSDIAIVRGPFPARIRKVLVPVRGGPHAELALRLALSLHPAEITVLHAVPPGADEADAPYHGLRQVVEGLPEVETRTVVTTDAVETILDLAADFDLLVLGSTMQPLNHPVTLGPIVTRLLREAPVAVIAVKNRRVEASPPLDELAGVKAISILVDKWFAENTYAASEFEDLEHLVALKQEQGLTISLALPALNEAETVGKVIRTIRRALMERVPLLDEIVLMDSSSTDRTRAIARRLGVPVFVHQKMLPDYGARSGKGEALWKSLLATRGDIIAWIDTDITNIHPRFVYGILGPLLLNSHIQFVKGFYRRPLRVGDTIQAGGGGRVTELTTRPLLNLFYPELSGVVQPLSGEYAGRRAALEQMSFFSGYGVETGLLIDMFEGYGISAIAQVDLLERIHHNQPLEALSKMSFAIIQAVMRKLERRYDRAFLADVNKSMKLIRPLGDGYCLQVEEIAERERPPMLELPEYRAWRAGLGRPAGDAFHRTPPAA